MGPALPVLMAILVGAPDSPGAPIPSATLRPVTCAGGETLAPLAERWAALAHAEDSRVSITIDKGSRLAAEGFAKFLKGEVDCVLFVREPFPAEEEAFRTRFGRDPVLAPVAGGSFATKGGTHAVAIYVNAANPLAFLSLGQLDALFSAERRRGGKPVETWGDLGLTGAWSKRPVHRYGMLIKRESGNPPGVVNFIQRRVLLGAPFRPDIDQQVDQPGEQALAAIVRKVGEDPDGVGFSGFGYAQGPVRTVPLAVTEGHLPIAGSPTTAADQSYPLSRKIYVMFDRPPGGPISPAIKAFVSAALSRKGQSLMADDKEHFLPLPRDERQNAEGLIR